MIWIPTAVLSGVGTVIACASLIALILLIATDLFVLYFFLSSLAGYVELREESVFIKLGFIMKIDIPYEKIRGFSRQRKIYSDSTVSIKNSLEHVNIKYNKFDLVSVSVVTNDELIQQIEKRIQAKSK